MTAPEKGIFFPSTGVDLTSSFMFVQGRERSQRAETGCPDVAQNGRHKPGPLKVNRDERHSDKLATL
jgi:hypothetical protein